MGVGAGDEGTVGGTKFPSWKRMNQKKMVCRFAGDAWCRLMIFSNFEIAIFRVLSLSLASSHFSIDWGCATESTNMKCGYTGIAKFISAMCCRDGSFSKLKWEKRITFSMLTINYIWMGKPSEREPGRAHRGYRGPEEKNVCQWILLWSRINTRKNKANEPTEPTEQYKYKRLDGRCCAWHIIRGQLGLGHFQMHQFKSNRTHAATTARKSMRE